MILFKLNSGLSRRILCSIRVIFVVVGLVSVLDADSMSYAVVQGASQTETVRSRVQGNDGDGVSIERLAGTPPLAFVSGPATVKLSRITLAPGAVVVINYRAPVLIFVESGELRLEVTGSAVTVDQAPQIVATASPGRSGSIRRASAAPGAGAQVVLTAGASAFSADGILGTLRNMGSERLTVLETALGPETPLDGVSTAEAEAIATPAP